MLDPETRSALRYILPMLVFGVLTSLEGYAPPAMYPAIYAAKIAAVTATLIVVRSTLRDLHPSTRVLLPAFAVGLVVCAIWVLLDRWLPYPHMGSRTAFNPFSSIPDDVQRAAFLAVRFYGLVLVVPVMEELFLRSYVLRVLTNSDFASVRVGDYSQVAFWSVAALSAVSHPEWLAAVITSILYTLLLGRTRSLFACVVAHGVTNAALGVYVLATGSFEYW